MLSGAWICHVQEVRQFGTADTGSRKFLDLSPQGDSGSWKKKINEKITQDQGLWVGKKIFCYFWSSIFQHKKKIKINSPGKHWLDCNIPSVGTQICPGVPLHAEHAGVVAAHFLPPECSWLHFIAVPPPEAFANAWVAQEAAGPGAGEPVSPGHQGATRRILSMHRNRFLSAERHHPLQREMPSLAGSAQLDTHISNSPEKARRTRSFQLQGLSWCLTLKARK